MATVTGDSGDNVYVGTPLGDTYLLQQGGNDTVTALGGDDGFYFGSQLTANDNVDGGDGRDYVSLQGNYPNLMLDGSFVNIELITLLSGSDTRYGESGSNRYDYVLVTDNANVGAGLQLIVDGGQLLADEDFTFAGAAESDGSFRLYGGLGKDDLTGGAQSDIFSFAPGRFGSSDTVDGGAGSARDQLSLRGDYVIAFGSAQLTSIESIVVLSGRDFAENTDYEYELTMDDGNLGAGVTMTIDAGQLRSTEALLFNGANEASGIFKIFGGAGDDSMIGGGGADRMTGGLGKDFMQGFGGADVFVYRSAADSTSTNFDRINGFTFGSDTIDMPGTHDSYQALNGGTLNSGATFNAELATAMTGILDPGEAVLFTPNDGSFSNNLFLIVDQNGTAGYQAGEDFVIQMLGAATPVSIPDFIV